MGGSLGNQVRLWLTQNCGSHSNLEAEGFFCKASIFVPTWLFFFLFGGTQLLLIHAELLNLSHSESSPIPPSLGCIGSCGTWQLSWHLPGVFLPLVSLVATSAWWCSVHSLGMWRTFRKASVLEESDSWKARTQRGSSFWHVADEAFLWWGLRPAMRKVGSLDLCVSGWSKVCAAFPLLI